MNLYKTLLRPLLFQCDPEWVHNRALFACHRAGNLAFVRSTLARSYRYQDPRLATELSGIHFDNPIGLAAGWDKNGRAIPLMEAIGFGHVEIGSVSAHPSQGNPKPRLWRLKDDKAIRVHFGLPNEGAAAVAARLEHTPRSTPLGVNLVKTNKGIDAPPDTEDTILDDYSQSVRLLQPHCDYLCLNLSCPNTAMGRDHFCEITNIRRLLDVLGQVGIQKHLFLKVSPLGGVAAIEGLLRAVEGVPFVSGFSFNLPPTLPEGLKAPRKHIQNSRGAVAGKPSETLINHCIAELYKRIDPDRYKIIGAGGVFSAQDAYTKILLGASLVQLMTGLIYEGPSLVQTILRGLSSLLERDGLRHISEAVGKGHPSI